MSEETKASRLRTPEEYQAAAILLGMVYDKYTHSFRHLSPEGSKYKYTGALHADTLEEFGKGVVLNIERGRHTKNNVSPHRTPGLKSKPYEPHWRWGKK